MRFYSLLYLNLISFSVFAESPKICAFENISKLLSTSTKINSDLGHFKKRIAEALSTQKDKTISGEDFKKQITGFLDETTRLNDPNVAEMVRLLKAYPECNIDIQK